MVANGFYPSPQEIPADEIEFICFGLPRSGSTLVYQFVSSLFRRGVVKVHRYCEQPVKTAASYRDFRDVTISQWRVAHPDNYRRKMAPAEIEAFAANCLRYVAALDLYRERDDTCLLRYEDFVRDPKVIFDAIRFKFDIVVTPARRTRLIRKFSIANNRRIARRFPSFRQHDKKTQIHGLHIYKGKIGGWREFVDDRGARRLERLLKPCLKRYGYEV